MKKALKLTAAVFFILLAMMLCACRSENVKKEDALNGEGYSSADITDRSQGSAEVSDTEAPVQQTTSASPDEDIIENSGDDVVVTDISESEANNTTPATTTVAATTSVTTTTAAATTVPPTSPAAESSQPEVTELKAADLSNFPYKTQEPSVIKDYAASEGMVSVEPGEEIVEVDGVQKHRYYFTIENTDEYNLDISYTINTYVYAGDGKWLWIDFGYEDPMDGNIIPPGQHTTIYYSFPDELPEASYIIEGRFWRQNDEQPRQTYFFSFIH